EAAAVVGDHAVAGPEQGGGLLLPGRAVQGVPVDEDDGLTAAVVLVVQLDVGAVLGADGDVTHGGSSSRWCDRCRERSFSAQKPREGSFSARGRGGAYQRSFPGLRRSGHQGRV